MKLLSIGNDAKTVKGEKKGYLTGIFYGAPHNLAGGISLCPHSTKGCRFACLYTAGHGATNFVQQARIAKTRFFLDHPVSFRFQLEDEIRALVKRAAKKGMIPAVRLNGTTDIRWETWQLVEGKSIIDEFPTVQFYDYTKYPENQRRNLPPNYHITYSFSEHKEAGQRSAGWRGRGFNTAVVFSGGLPEEFNAGYWQQLPVIDGDLSDLRFTDPQGVIVGLKTKGKARGVVDAGTGFVQLGESTR